ncbi:GntT/GntP/DsdX family permease [Streptomyces celluloflavus]|uniref:GntT/GntP/DsdX family permease n=1 Tax=Streptomyces celluloflavus TaxID=58344 RepID=UPI00367D70AE
MIGKILEATKGTERIATWLLEALGERRAAVVLGITGMLCGIVLFFDVAVLLRVMLGSTTVATMTVAALALDMVKDLHWTQPQLALLVLAIGSGGMCMSHFNDPGFWVQSRYFDIDEGTMLRTWTPSITVAGTTSFLMVCALSLFIR